MKIVHRIPTTQYGYVEVIIELEKAEPEEIRKSNDLLLDAFAEKPINTLPDKEMTDFIQNMLQGGKNHIETWEKMNPAQKIFINQLKKALARKPLQEQVID